MCLTTVSRWNDRSYGADDTLLLVVQIRPPETRAEAHGAVAPGDSP